MIHFATESPADVAQREALLDRVMPDRHLKPSEHLRRGRLPARGLALTAHDDTGLVGTVRLWNVAADGRPLLLLGPLCVAPALAGKGIGAGLMQLAIARAGLLGHDGIVLVGEPDYYARFGFTAAPTDGLTLPAPVERRRLLGLELRDGAVSDASGMLVAVGEPAEMMLAA